MTSPIETNRYPRQIRVTQTVPQTGFRGFGRNQTGFRNVLTLLLWASMGFEYRIQFNPPPGFSAEQFSERLPNTTTVDSEHALYDYRVEADGFYFVDYGKSQIASVAFRQLIDEALRHSQTVTIEEL